MIQHTLKTWPAEFSAVLAGEKRHETRRADREFSVGDVLRLREWDPEREAFTGRECERVITYVTGAGSWGLPADLCVLSIAAPPVAGADPRAWRETRESEAPASVRLVAARLLGLVDALVIRDEAGTVLPRVTATAQAYVRDAAEALTGGQVAQRACEDVAAELSPLIDPACTDPSELACRAASEITELRAAAARGAEGERSFDKRGADRLADEVARLIELGVIGSRSRAADALLDYRDPPNPAPRPSAGPAAPPASDDTARLVWIANDLGTTPEEFRKVIDENRAKSRPAAAPAAPEVP